MSARNRSRGVSTSRVRSKSATSRSRGSNRHVTSSSHLPSRSISRPLRHSSVPAKHKFSPYVSMADKLAEERKMKMATTRKSASTKGESKRTVAKGSKSKSSTKKKQAKKGRAASASVRRVATSPQKPRRNIAEEEAAAVAASVQAMRSAFDLNVLTERIHANVSYTIPTVPQRDCLYD
jgi:hypothetical protein